MRLALGGLLRDALAGGAQVDEARGNVLLAQAQALAASLAQHGLLPQEPVHLHVGRGAADLVGMLGIWLAGGVVVPLHVTAAASTIDALGQATGARLVVGDMVTVIAAASPAPRAMLSGAALVVFTSGTTGRAKGVVIGHAALEGKLDVLGRLLGLRPGDVVVSPLQLTFIFGIWAALLALRSGARLVLLPKFSRGAIEAELAGGATVLAAVPSMLRALHTGAPPATGALRMLLTGGETLDPVLGGRIGQGWPGIAVFDLYGSTETGSCDFARQVGPELSEGVIGHPTEGVDYRIAANGELCIRTPFGMAGYLDNPSLTAAAFVDEYFLTGDIARALPGGTVALIGRLKELVSRGGNKIAPQEIDNLLAAHPSVSAALSTGLPDERLGETLHSVVVPALGAAVSSDGLRAWLAERVERFKVPDSIRIVDALPSGPTGKASRAALRALLSSQETMQDRGR